MKICKFTIHTKAGKINRVFPLLADVEQCVYQEQLDALLTTLTLYMGNGSFFEALDAGGAVHRWDFANETYQKSGPTLVFKEPA